MERQVLETVRAGGAANCSEATFDELCRLALAAMPVVEWVQFKSTGTYRAEVGRFILFADHRGCWSIDIGSDDNEDGGCEDVALGNTLDHTHPPHERLKAAKAAAEEALLGLIRGENA